VPAGEPAGEKTPRAEGAPSIERFLGDPTRQLSDWRWLWDGDHKFPVRSHRGVFGGLIVAFKRLLRPFVTAPQADLWERQRIYNLILLEYVARAEEIRRHVLEDHEKRFAYLEAVWREGLSEVMEHNDALFARVDQKLDRSRREIRDVWAKLGSALAVAEQGGVPALAAVREEQAYVELERRFRGTESDISSRLEPYLPRLRGRGEVLDLGCGRGEALALLAGAGIPARGVDGSQAMVDACREKGLTAECGDLFAVLAGAAPESLGGVVSFHVIEHLPAESLDRLVRLAWRALTSDGVLILETPNPLSLVVAARNFWIDPTHRRPVHPETLEFLYRLAGFDPVERLDLRPFPAAARLPEILLDELAESARPLAHRVNELRDRLDDLLFGAQDYAIVGTKQAKG
jgi:SAM-dependent methyltransferase